MKTRRIALVVAVAGIAVLLFGLLTPTTSGDSDGGMNGGSETVRTTYTINNVVIIMIGALISGASLSFWAFREDYVPVALSTSSPATKDGIDEMKEVPAEAPKEPETGSETGSSPISGEDRLVLRLLNGDERHMYRTIVDLGGSALQKDLIVKTKMSDAKVSRVIDRLIEKGLVTKERYGVTNKVSISIEK
jgi:uncharacterized membrane protein